MKTIDKQKRNRIIALSFVSVLMLLMYGPLAQWFIAADRVLYDQLQEGDRPRRSTMPTSSVSIRSVHPPPTFCLNTDVLSRSCRRAMSAELS